MTYNPFYFLLELCKHICAKIMATIATKMIIPSATSPNVPNLSSPVESS